MKLNVRFSEKDQSFKPKFGEVFNISDGGYERGYAEGEVVGYEKGHTTGQAEGIEQGKQIGYENGHAEGYDEGKSMGLYYATNLNGTFDKTVFPNDYVIVIKTQKTPVTAYGAFGGTTGLKSVKFIAEDANENKPYSFQHAFNGSGVEVVDLTECSRRFTHMGYCFFQANTLKRILGALDLTECVANHHLVYAFFCGALEHVEIMPNTIFSDIRFTSGALTQTSIESIINGLADLTGGTAKTLTLNSVGSKLTDAQKAAITVKNWTLAV